MSALVPMPALSDLEDSPPHFRSTMPDNEITETLAPPTDREAPTNVENETPEPRVAIRPQPADPWDTSFLRADDSVFSQAVKLVASAGRRMDEEREARRAVEEDERSAKRQVLEQQDKILAAIERADRNGDTNWKATQHQIETWRKVDNAKNAEQDDRLSNLEAKVSKLEADILALVRGALTEQLKPILDEFDAIKLAIEELKNGTARPVEASTAAQP